MTEFGEQLALAGDQFGQDLACRVQELGHVAVGQGAADGGALPYGMNTTIPERRRTASCRERLDGSIPIALSRSRTGTRPFYSSSRTRMRTGRPSIRQNPALAC